MDRELLPSMYKDLLRMMVKFMSQAENGSEIDLMTDVVKFMISDAKDVAYTQTKRREALKNIIAGWELKQRADAEKKEAPSDISPSEEKQEEHPDEEEASDKPMKVVPVDELPDRDLLKDMEPVVVHKRRGRPPKHPVVD